MEGISYIISTRWASEILEIQLNSIRDNCTMYPKELKIICDMPSWQTLKLLQDRGLQHGIDYYIVNHGHLDQNLDWGVSKANYNYICLTPDDMVLAKDFDKHMMKHMGNSNNRIVTPAYFVGNTPNSPMYRNFGYPKWKYSHESRFDGNGFDYEKFYNYPVPHSTYTIDACGSSPLQLMHKDVYKKVHGLTFCSPHAQGHEIELMARAWQKYRVEKIMALEAIAFHFGTIGNTDAMNSTGDVVSKGHFKCTVCGKLDPSLGNEEHFKTERGRIILRTGLYLCERCQKDNWAIDEHRPILYQFIK